MQQKDTPKNVVNIVVDADTGEVVEQENYTLVTHAEVARRRQHSQIEREQTALKQFKLDMENKTLRLKCGFTEDESLDEIPSSFIWAYFQEQQRMFPDLKTQDISRLVYLSTYAEFNTNKLKSNGSYVEPSEVFKLMNLDRKTYKAWIQKMLDHDYIEFKRGRVIINDNFIFKGPLGELMRAGGEKVKAVRLFTDMVRELYLNLTPAEHHKMGVVLQMIPYINPYFNCLAKNPNTNEIEHLVPMTLGELAEKLGYSIKQCRRLGNDILGMRFGAGRKRIAVMVALDDMKPENMIVLFNAKLFFGGSALQYNEVNRLFESFGSEVIFELPSY